MKRTNLVLDEHLLEEVTRVSCDSAKSDLCHTHELPEPLLYHQGKMALALLCVLCIAALGCGGNGRYQIVAVDGPCDAYRLDTQTGETLCLKSVRSIPVEPLEASESGQ